MDNWSIASQERNENGLQELRKTRSQEDAVAAMVTLPRHDQQRFARTRFRRQQEGQYEKSNLFSRETAEYSRMMAQELAAPLSRIILELINPIANANENMMTTMKQVFKEMSEIKQGLQRLSENAQPKPTKATSATKSKGDRTPKGKVRSKSLPGIATRDSIDEERRLWLLTAPWNQFPNWKRWKSETKVLFERVMEEQADKARLDDHWLVKYTHNTLNRQRILASPLTRVDR